MLRRTFDKSRKVGRVRSAQTHSITSVLARKSIACEVEAEIYIDGIVDTKTGKEVASTVARCTKCQHETKSFGVKEPSQRRCLVLLKSECPRRENNFYVEKEKVFQCENCGEFIKASEWRGDDLSVCPKCETDSIPF